MEESGEKDEELFSVARSEAAVLKRLRLNDASIKRFTKALTLVPNERNCLVERGKCHLALGDNKKAQTDAENSLTDDKNFYRGILMRAEAFFHRGDFEMALVNYHRGNKLRPEVQEFRLGIQKAQEAIENSVGTPERVKLNTTGDLSFFTEQDEKKKRKPNPGSSGRLPLQHKSSIKKNLYRSPAHERTIKQMLGELYGDQKYLEKLLKSNDACKDMTSKTVTELADEGLTYLDSRTDFWSQQKPMYARKYEQGLMRKRYCSKRKISDDYIICELERIDEAQSQFKYKEALKRAQNCMTTVEGYTESQLANKQALRAQLNSCMGNAYLEMGNFDKALHHHHEDYYLGEKFNFEEAMGRGLDNLGRVYARMGEFDRATKVWETKLVMARWPLEISWLCHEIGRCNMELDRAEQAQDYGLRAQAAAQQAEDRLWQLHATVLVAQAHVKLEKYADAIFEFEHAMDLAAELEDVGAEEALQRAMEEVRERLELQTHQSEMHQIASVSRLKLITNLPHPEPSSKDRLPSSSPTLKVKGSKPDKDGDPQEQSDPKVAEGSG